MQALKDLPADHDLAHLEAALHYVTCWEVAVDGGAHRGIWTRRMASQFGRVYAFEPVASNARHIPDLPNVEIEPVALGDGYMRVGMKPGPENTGQYHVCGGWTHQVAPLDCYELDGVGLLKLDVEGYEYLALLGSDETIRRCRPVVVVEENGLTARYGTSDEAVRDFLTGHGYRRAERHNKDTIYVPCETLS